MWVGPRFRSAWRARTTRMITATAIATGAAIRTSVHWSMGDRTLGFCRAHRRVVASVESGKQVEPQARLHVDGHLALADRRQLGDELGVPASIEGAHALLDECVARVQ